MCYFILSRAVVQKRVCLGGLKEESKANTYADFDNRYIYRADICSSNVGSPLQQMFNRRRYIVVLEGQPVSVRPLAESDRSLYKGLTPQRKPCAGPPGTP